jgi:hypothetical protein
MSSEAKAPNPLTPLLCLILIACATRLDRRQWLRLDGNSSSNWDSKPTSLWKNDVAFFGLGRIQCVIFTLLGCHRVMTRQFKHMLGVALRRLFTFVNADLPSLADSEGFAREHPNLIAT